MNFTAQLAIVICLLGLWAAVLRLRLGLALPPVARANIKFTHVLPSILQAVLFTYWAMYWSPVVAHVPVLAVQLVFAYAFDFLFAWTTRRAYVPTFGPVPIVLSANLFVWFPQALLLNCLVIAAALASKSLLLRDGRHIFNPSAFGVAVAGSLCILLPALFSYQDVSHDFDRAPYMAHLILLLALIPQLRLGTTPVALGAAITMLGTMLIVFSLTGYRGGPSPWWPPWLLAITLLAGDPATIPSTPLSRLLFGLFLGFAFYVLSRAMLVSIGTDFFSKVIAIPFANFLVPTFDHMAHRLALRRPAWARESRVYLVVWLSLSILMLALEGRT